MLPFGVSQRSTGDDPLWFADEHRRFGIFRRYLAARRVVWRPRDTDSRTTAAAYRSIERRPLSPAKINDAPPRRCKLGYRTH